jgi:ribosome-associated translation inhibitor RaiA
MEAIEAVLELAKERDHIAEELETYEEWFETLVGHRVSLKIKSKKHTRFVDCVVSEFIEGEGWELKSEEDDTVYTITFLDFVLGLVHVYN